MLAPRRSSGGVGSAHPSAINSSASRGLSGRRSPTWWPPRLIPSIVSASFRVSTTGSTRSSAASRVRLSGPSNTRSPRIPRDREGMTTFKCNASAQLRTEGWTTAASGVEVLRYSRSTHRFDATDAARRQSPKLFAAGRHHFYRVNLQLGRRCARRSGRAGSSGG
jgi:hypothetical protein